MYQLRIEHSVPDYNNWKRAFDSDPVNRNKIRILRPIDNPSYVIIDLDFDSVQHAEALLAAMREVWKNVEGKIIMNPQVRISEIVQTTTI
ncbi:MAG: hypothetical protein Q7U53_01225 [Anaerolineaceae bacterium]|nr:hypothetical protein [Anaerolineaceae bacterium]